MAWIVLTGIVFAVLLELNKNSIIGWLLALAVFAGYLLLYRRVLRGQGRWLRAGGLLVLAAALAAVLAFTPPPYRLHPATGGKNPAVTDVITVEQGQLTGLVSEDGQIEVYAGIPYALPPVGGLRWKEPQDPVPWEGVFRADHFAPMSFQPDSGRLYGSLADIIGYHDYRITLQDNYRDMMSEDSLYLNIWKPAGEVHDAPVLVYVHGGSLMTGQPWYADYSGEGLARDGVIVVNMGYRLGVFGFYADPDLAAESPAGTTGNYGLLDQIKALEWVRDNIRSFGGDPDNVTLAGESAGSACVSALCASPLAKGLFRRVIGESSTTAALQPAHSFRSLESAYRAAAATRERFNASSIEDMRKIPAEELVAETDRDHHIAVDGYVLPETPYESYSKGIHNEEAILHGYNLEEGKLFLIMDRTTLKNYREKVGRYFGEYADEVLELYPAANDKEAAAAWEKIYSVIYFSYGHHCWTGLAQENGIPVFEYWFTGDNKRLGAAHSGEEVYFYGNIPADSRLYDEGDRELGRIMKQYFRNYITSGDPNGEGLPVWEAVSDPDEIFELGSRVGPVREEDTALFRILDRMQGR